jgi:uncharacterized protein (DUF1697 family)
MSGVFVALLRGVNVGGNPLPMAGLRARCAELGARDVRTYLQSGNVVFTAGATAAQWEKRLAEALAGDSRLPVAVVVRTAAELRAVHEGNPFLGEDGVDPKTLHVTFLARTPAASAVAALAARESGGDRLRVAGREVYLHCPGGYGRTKLGNPVIERVAGCPATTRNWNTVTALVALATTAPEG